MWGGGLMSNRTWPQPCSVARIVVTFAVRGLTLTGQALDGPVLSALKRGMDVLEYPEARPQVVIRHWNDGYRCRGNHPPVAELCQVGG